MNKREPIRPTEGNNDKDNVLGPKLVEALVYGGHPGNRTHHLLNLPADQAINEVVDNGGYVCFMTDWQKRRL